LIYFFGATMTARSQFPPPVRRNLSNRAGNKCSNPDCRAPTSGAQRGGNAAIDVGIAAHITAASPGGPRYDHTLSPKDRNSLENGIWLCIKCHALVDHDPGKYTIGLLHVWKRHAEDASHNEVMSSSTNGSSSTTDAQVVGGRYRLLEHIGEGELATVHRALDLHSTSQDEVAIKILRGERACERKAKMRFYRGAETMRKLDRNPYVVKLLDISDENGNGPYFYVMEFIAQGHLMQYARSKRLQWNEVLRLGLEVGDALAAAHGLRKFHRDVKPANVLIDMEGHARLTDFDLVRDEYNSGGTTTESLGTLGYRAPEHPRSADQKSDQYSLAMTLIATIARKDATPQNAKTLVQMVFGQIPPEISAVLEKALCEDPKQRHDSIEEFCDAIANALDTTESRTSAFSNPPGAVEKEAAAGSFASAPVSKPIATNPAPETTRLGAPTPTRSASSGRAMVIWTATASALAVFAILVAGAWSRPESTTSPPSPPTPAPSNAGSPAIPMNRSVSDAELDEVLRVDHSKTAFAIRITADNTLEEARENARAVLRTSRFQPWIIHQRFGKGLYIVYVGGYSDRVRAEADFKAAKAVRNEGGYVHSMPEECPTIEWTPARYHDCAR